VTSVKGNSIGSATATLDTKVNVRRKRMRTKNGGCRRDHPHALAQRVEVDAKEVRIRGSKSVLLRTLVAASSAKTAGFGSPSSVPRAGGDSNLRPHRRARSETGVLSARTRARPLASGPPRWSRPQFLRPVAELPACHAVNTGGGRRDDLVSSTLPAWLRRLSGSRQIKRNWRDASVRPRLRSVFRSC
jgi:hypothetical protein